MKITEKSSCCGCRACAEVCPKQCITMEKDDESFFYPVIDGKACVQCGLCQKVCPILCSELQEIQTAIAGIHKDESVVKGSASGGAFSALSEHFCNEGYTVFGTICDENFQVVVEGVDGYENIDAFRKSKYVQSDTNHCFSKVKGILDQGGKVLFSGTPCQVAAMKNFIHNEDADIFYIDIICHGVASQDCFDEEIKWISKKHGGAVKNYRFKNKQRVHGAYNSRSAMFEIDGKEKGYLVDYIDDPYLRGYYSRLFYRPSCGKCPFAQKERAGDITLGDAWGIEELYPEWNSLKGVSLLLANSQKGKRILMLLQEKMFLIPVDKDWAIAHNQQLRQSTDMHTNRQLFFEKFKKDDFGKLVFSLTRRSLKQYTLDFLRRVRNYSMFYIKER